jgi:hypothetical protein
MIKQVLKTMRVKKKKVQKKRVQKRKRKKNLQNIEVLSKI